MIYVRMIVRDHSGQEVYNNTHAFSGAEFQELNNNPRLQFEDKTCHYSPLTFVIDRSGHEWRLYAEAAE